MAFNWQCPTCGRHVTLDKETVDTKEDTFCTDSMDRKKGVFSDVRILYQCPNPDCNACFLQYWVYEAQVTSPSGSWPVKARSGKKIASFTVLPSVPQPLSNHVPGSVAEDYAEAYAIRELSPKASATLSRRALQGMVRDFWKVSERTLHHELEAIQDRCDPDIYAAVMGLKSVGNLGAHPERDINLIVEVEAGEAEELLSLLRQLDQEWYVVREDRKLRLARIAAMKTKVADATANQANQAASPTGAPIGSGS